LTLRGKEQAVVTLRCSVIRFRDESHQLPVPRTFEAEAPALVGVRCCRTAWNVDRRIDLPLAPKMSRLGSNVGRRQKPVGSNLSWQAEIPRRRCRCLHIESRALHIRICRDPRIGAFDEREWNAAGKIPPRIFQRYALQTRPVSPGR